jgi:hypothetical protein
MGKERRRWKDVVPRDTSQEGGGDKQKTEKMVASSERGKGPGRGLYRRRRNVSLPF